MPDPSPTPASRVVERIAPHRDPLTRVRTHRFGRPPVLELYYEPGDPHSHLAAQLLPALAERVRTDIEVRLVGESTAEDYPERERQRAYAIEDATRIAPARGLRFPAGATPPGDEARAWGAAELAKAADAADFARREREVAARLFAGEGGVADAPRELLDANAKRRAKLGHYLPAVWQFDGDWFWGVDRLGFLEARLRERGLLGGDAPLSDLDPHAAALPHLATPLPPLEFFYSVRSPYSYLALLEMRDFHTTWPAGVVVRPVLPMAMRSISIPRAKRLYTLRDVKRLSDRRGIPFGRVADPLGDGARRLLEVFPSIEGTERQLDFFVSAARAVWSEGIDVSTDDGLRFVCERAGVEWAAGGEIEYAEENRLDLLDAGLWGVPCYRAGDFVAWGQDRFWMLGELLRRAGAEQRAA